MAKYPVKLLKDKDGTAFIPVVNSDSIITPEGDTLDDLLDEKQDTLVSGTNLKTINNQSLLGSGNITIEGGGTVNTYYLVNILNMTSTSDATYEIVNDLINNNQFVILDDPDGRFREMFYYVPIKTYAESGQTMQKFWYIDNQDKYNLVVITHSGTSVTVTRTTYHSIEEAYNLANGKQDALVSGTNIKTINNESILGSGNIEISGSGNVQELSSDFYTWDLEEGFYRTSSSVVIWYHDDGTVYQDTLPAWTRLNVFRAIEPGDNEQYSAIWHLYIEVYAPTSENIRKNIYYECSYRDITSGEHYLGYGTKYSIIPTTNVRTNVKINGTSITSNGQANIVTKGVYNSSSNKIATMTDVSNAVASKLDSNWNADDSNGFIEWQEGENSTASKLITKVASNTNNNFSQTEITSDNMILTSGVNGAQTNTSINMTPYAINITNQTTDGSITIDADLITLSGAAQIATVPDTNNSIVNKKYVDDIVGDIESLLGGI